MGRRTLTVGFELPRDESGLRHRNVADGIEYVDRGVCLIPTSDADYRDNSNIQIRPALVLQWAAGPPLGTLRNHTALAVQKARKIPAWVGSHIRPNSSCCFFASTFPTSRSALLVRSRCMVIKMVLARNQSRGRSLTISRSKLLSDATQGFWYFRRTTLKSSEAWNIVRSRRSCGSSRLYVLKSLGDVADI